MAGTRTKMTEARREKQREYMRAYVARKKAAQLAMEREGGLTVHGTRKISSAERSRISKAAWRAKRIAEVEQQMPTVQMETTVDVPTDIEPGILAVGQVENGVVHEMPPFPTGATLAAGFFAELRKLAIAVREAGAEYGVFYMPDGTSFKVRGDGAIITS